MNRCLFIAIMAFIVGCQTEPPPAPVVNVIVEDKMPVASQPPRKRTAEQIQLLQEFAQKESPEVWRTIQSLRGEMSESARNLKRLRDQLIEFDRNPDLDEDYKALRFGLQDLKRAYEAIYDNLENAYIAAKKFEASPSRKEYQDMMKKAFDDGIQNATIATERYKMMMRQK
jgi:hypothetical protein